MEISRTHMELINKMVKDIEKYYPIKIDVDRDTYSGYEKLKEITAKKIDQLIAEEIETPYNKLIEAVQREWMDLIVRTQIEAQYPNYSIALELGNREYAEITVVNTLQLRLSLLGNYFTAFYDQTIIHSAVQISEVINLPAQTCVLSSRSQAVDPQREKLQRLKKVVKEIFPDYDFVPHEILFKNHIGHAVPIGFDISKAYSLYHFLFGNDYHVFPFFVAE